MKQAWIGLGGNVGDVRSTMRDALSQLDAEDCQVATVSSLYETPPWGFTEQPRFLNACASLRTALAPAALLARLHEIEAALARVRTRRWGPRTIDLDLLAYEGFSGTDPALSVPHPRIAERPFVLVPLAEIAPGLMIDGTRVEARADAIDRGDMRLVSRAPW